MCIVNIRASHLLQMLSGAQYLPTVVDLGVTGVQARKGKDVNKVCYKVCSTSSGALTAEHTDSYECLHVTQIRACLCDDFQAYTEAGDAT